MTHTVMEAEKSPNLPSVSCRPRKAGDVVQNGLGGGGWGCWCKSQSLKARERGALFPKAGEDECPNPKRENLSVLPIQALKNWRMPPTLGRVMFLLSPLARMSVSSRNALADTPANHVLPALWASLRPAKLTHQLNHGKPYFCLLPFLYSLPPSGTSYLPLINTLCPFHPIGLCAFLFACNTFPYHKTHFLRRGYNSVFTNWH